MRTLDWLVWLALAALLGHRCLLDQREPQQCDTTYLWQGYEKVLRDGGRYRLIAFRDADTSRAAAFQQLQQRHVVPVLFVHGHLGSHQQMRSAASETGREVARRLAADPRWPLHLQWYAADFAAEASALDAGLLDKQADFVLRCIQHLQQLHASNSTGAHGQGQQQPFRLVLVAYSMGGAVARRALRRLAADPSFDLGQVVVLVTLGTPSHFPRFMPHAPLSKLLAPAASGGSSAAAGAAEAAAAAVPRANIVAGAADYFLPHTLGGARVPAAPGAEEELTLLMRDVPGVWTSSGHKSIVSCNQLVRQLAPLLVDATAASLQPGSTAERQAAIQQMLQHRLATDAAAALGQKGPERAAAAAAAASAPAQGCAIDRHPGAASEQTPPLIDAPLFIGRVPAGALVRLAWDAGRLQGDGGHGLLLLVHAAPPCSQWSLVTTPLEGPSRQLAPAAAALPPLLPRLQQRWVPRHWEDLVGGIDWQQNATRLLYLPFQGPAGEQLDTISTGVVGGASGDTLLLAQVLPSDPLRHPLQLKKPGGSCCSKAALLPDGHPAVRALQLPRDAWPLGGCPGGARSLLNRDCLLAVLLGTTPPWNLHIQARACDTARGHPDGLLPAVVGMAAGAAPAVSVRVATPAEPSSAGSSSGVVQLWDGMQGVESGRLLLVSDPGCSYSLRLEWDLQGWLGLSLRQLLFVLPPLCVALSQARLSPLGGAAMRVSAAAAAVAAWCSLHPEALGAAATSLHPWLRLSVVEALAALVLAGGLSSLLAAAQSGGWRLLRALLPAGVVARGGALRWAGAAAVCGGALVHPALAAYAGVLSLALQLAAASKLAGKGNDAGEQRGQEWLAFYGQLVLLPSAALYSWLAGGAGGELGRSDGRVLTALLALHAALGWCGSQEAQQAPAAPRRLAAAAVHEAAAATAAACCLWGHPFACMYAACASAVAQVLWG